MAKAWLGTCVTVATQAATIRQSSIANPSIDKDLARSTQKKTEYLDIEPLGRVSDSRFTRIRSPLFYFYPHRLSAVVCFLLLFPVSWREHVFNTTKTNIVRHLLPGFTPLCGFALS